LALKQVHFFAPAAGAGVCVWLELSRHLPNDFGLGLHHIDTRHICTVISGDEKAVKKN